MLSSLQAAGRGIRTNCGASCPFGSLDRGGCGLVVGDDTACCLRPVSIPVGRLSLPATPPLLLPCSLLAFWRMSCPDASLPRHRSTPRPPPYCRRSTHTPLASMLVPRSYGSVSP